jgi:hypothetical protein
MKSTYQSGISIRKSKKSRQHNGQQKKSRQHNGQQKKSRQHNESLSLDYMSKSATGILLEIGVRVARVLSLLYCAFVCFVCQ